MRAGWFQVRSIIGLPAEQFHQFSAAWHRSGHYIMAAAAHGAVCVYHLGSAKRVATVAAHTKNVRGLSYDGEHNLLLTCRWVRGCGAGLSVAGSGGWGIPRQGGACCRVGMGGGHRCICVPSQLRLCLPPCRSFDRSVKVFEAADAAGQEAGTAADGPPGTAPLLPSL